jgi:hypothetical protein
MILHSKKSIGMFLFIMSCNLFFGSRTTGQNADDLNTNLMRSTFKIVGKGSVGTAFVLGVPLKEDPKRRHLVLITANHVLDQMKEENATLFLRKKSGEVFEKKPREIRIRRGKKKLWVKHPDEDIAVMNLDLPREYDK